MASYATGFNVWPHHSAFIYRALHRRTLRLVQPAPPVTGNNITNITILNSTEMDFWRRTARISRKDKIRNTIIKQKMNVTRSLLDDIKTKQLQWYGHVQRMEDGRLPKEVLRWRPLGRRKRGRPKLTWTEGIKGLMGEKGFMDEDWNDRSN
jgi:hypothetical protein